MKTTIRDPKKHTYFDQEKLDHLAAQLKQITNDELKQLTIMKYDFKQKTVYLTSASQEMLRLQKDGWDILSIIPHRFMLEGSEQVEIFYRRESVPDALKS